MTAPEQGSAGADGNGPPNRLVTILSPKGGSGKTSVGTNLAVGLAAQHPREVVLVDLDLQFGDVASVLRQSPTSTIGDLARKWPVDSATIKLALTSHQTGIYTLCAPVDPAAADEVGAEHVSGVLSALHQSFRFVVVDTDPGLSERVLSALDVCTDIVMVCATEMPSIRGLAKALEALDVVGITEPRRHFLLNRSNAKVGIEFADIERAIGASIDVEVPSSIEMVRATNGGIPIMESREDETLVKAFQRLVDRFDPVESEVQAGGGRRLFKRRS